MELPCSVTTAANGPNMLKCTLAHQEVPPHPLKKKPKKTKPKNPVSHKELLEQSYI